MALNFNWLKTKKLEDIYKVQPVNTQMYLKPPAPVMRPLQAPAQQRPQVMPTVAFTPTPIKLNTFNKLPTSPQNTINNILRVSPNAVVPQKKNNWAEDWYNKTQLKKAITDIPDIFDANSASDRQKRLQAGQKEIYADDMRNLYETSKGKQGSLRPYQNLGAGIVGQTARGINTLGAAGRETQSTINVGVLQALGLNKEANALMDANTLAQQRDYQWNSGLLGQGTIFNNPEEYGNLSALELSKRIGATTVGAGLEIIPFTKGAGIGATAFYKGLSPAKQILTRSVLGAGENAIQDVAEQQLTNPSGWRPQQTALAAGLGTLMPNVGPVLGGAKNLARYPANKAALDLVNQQNITQQALKQLDELNQAKPNKSSINKYLTKEDIEEFKQNNIDYQAGLNREKLYGEISPEQIELNRTQNLQPVGNTDKLITVYRGTADGDSIKANDFVTTNKKLAEELGRVTKAKIPEKNLSYTQTGNMVYTTSKPKVAFKEAPQVGKAAKDGLQPIDAAYSVKTKADIIPEQAKMIAQQSGASVSDVERNIRKFGFDATNNTYSQLRDSMGYDSATKKGIKSIDAVATAKLNKSAPQVGKPVVTAKPTITIKKQLDGSSYYLPKEKLPVLNSEGKPAPLGTIVDTFYKSKKGNKEIDFNTLEKLGKTVADSARRNLNAIGSNYEDVMLKIHQGLADGKKTLLDAGLTPAERKIRLAELSELNYARYKRALGRGGVGEGDFGEMYVPNQRIGQYKGEGTLFEGYRSSKPANEYIRQNEIPIAERDLTPDVTAEYIPRYGDNKLYQTERIARAVKKVNPETTEESVKNAAFRIIDLQRRTNELENSIGLGGLGRRRTRTASEGLRVETATELSDIGKLLGKEQTVIDETPRGWTNGDRINSVKTPTGEVLGDYIGLNQHREARSFANSQTQNAAGDRAVLAASVKERLMTAYNIPEESATYISESIGRIKKDIPQAIVQGKVERSYKMAAKQQIMENLQTLDIKNNKLNTDITDLTNQILTEGYIENTTSTKVVGGILKGTNAIFRKLNLGSALNELSDLTGLVTVYGRKTNLLKPNFSLIEKYGLGDIDPALAPYIKATQRGDSLKSILASIDTKTNLYRYVETYKSAVLASTAEKFHKNLSGDALTEQILLDYRNMVLPVDEFTKTFADSAPLYTQYMSWGIRNLQKELRLAGGKLDTGIMKDKTRLSRVARNAYANLPAKTVFWLASNALKGTPILTAFGINDYIGATHQDFSGIKEEDKSVVDKLAPPIAGNSPTLSLLFSVYQSYEKEQMKNDPNYEGLNPYKDNNFVRQSTSVFTPQAVKNAYGVPEIKDGQLVFSGGADDLMRQGYSTNAAGKIQYAAPTDPYNTAKAYVFGKGSTQKAREYSGKTNIIDRMKMGQTTNPVDFVTNFARSVDDMAKEQTNIRDTNYNYPVSDRYQDLINAGANVQETIDKSRATQKIDKEYYNSPEGKAYKEANATVWNSDTKKYESNLITPEKWKIINAEKSGKTFERNKQSAENRNRDFGDPIDPIYSNKWSSRAKEVMDMRMQNTGDDTEMKDIAYATKPWYKEYMKDYIAYINAQKNRVYGENSDFGPSNRVKEYQELTINNPAIPTNSEKNYPLINQYMTIKNGNDRGVAANPELAKDFYKANATQLSADFDKQKVEKFIWTNKMRQLEGASPIEWGTFQNVTFGYEDDERKVFNELKYGKGFGGFGGDKTAGSAYKYNLSRGSKVGAVKFKKFSQSAKPLTFKKKNYSMPKVTMKKSKV